ncbi:phage tail tube protein [Zavarzinia aquatilis]|uniref:phage tail tube protein n=1 Tax=Zavarzinia aquatilis TaxID=2211142 RepID=UPI001057C64C|nr:phage tail tube protein [Zavarzinia aquatilis]
MAYKWEQKFILLKPEVTYGTDSVPAAGTNAFLTANGQIKPLVHQKVARNLDGGRLGNEGELVVGEYVELSFDVEAAGSGAAGTAPAYGPALIACAMAETVVATTRVDYKPVDSGEASASIYFYIGRLRHKIVGARGTVKLTGAALAIPKFQFTFIGLWVGVSDYAQGNGSGPMAAFKDPEEVSFANTLITLHGSTLGVKSFDIDFGVENQYRNITGYEGIIYGDRQAKGSILFEAPDITTKDWLAAIKAETRDILTITHGSAAGKKVIVSGPKVQLVDPAYQEDQKLLMIQAGLNLCVGTVADDFTITIQ